MQISLYLVDNRPIQLDVEPEEWRRAFEEALRENTVVQINDPETGGEMGINPRMVLYWKTVVP